MHRLLRNKPLIIGAGLLLAGQVLYLFGFELLYVLALIFVLAVGLIYPAILHSIWSRLVAAFLMAFSLMQLAAALQFFVLPNSRFPALSVLVTAGTLALTGALQFTSKQPANFVWWDRRDVVALVAVIFFIAPLGGLCFWKNNPVRLTFLGGIQSPDGTSHLMGINEMMNNQHIDYRTVDYYPKGFHLAAAFMLKAVHAAQPELSWVANARLFFFLYILAGSLVAYLLVYLTLQLLESFGKRLPWLTCIVIALSVGPVLSLMYLLPFVYDGFINYYYICAAVILGVLFLTEYEPSPESWHWPVIAYLILIFGVSMSWGPLLAPALFLSAMLAVLPRSGSILAGIKTLLGGRYWLLWLAFVLQLVPLYLHVHYARLPAKNGIDAVGIIRTFDFGIVLAGLLLAAWVMLSSSMPAMWRRFAVNILMPFYFLVAVMVGIQYFSVGELRYYAIKTAYLLEMLVIAASAALLVHAATKSRLSAVERLFTVPVVFGMAAILLVGISGANPLLGARQIFRRYSSYGTPANYGDDVRGFTDLAVSGKLVGTNVEDMHYNVQEQKIFGDGLIDNWVTTLLPVTDNTPETADCNGTLFRTLTYGTGQPSEQPTIIAAAKRCISLAIDSHHAYYIVTDNTSVPYLQHIFGNTPTYVTQPDSGVVNG